MSIRIDGDKCIGCFSCINVCPGSLIYKNNDGKAYIKYEKDCWGCTACVKECESKAIKYYLGADLGGNGSYLYTSQDENKLEWHINKDENEVLISTNRKKSNKY